MRGLPDLRFLWAIGAIMLVFCSVGAVSVGAIVALPLAFAVFGGIAEETAVQIFLYSSPIWSPLGVGIGAAASASLSRGIRRRIPEGGERVQ
jgi:hypothetical protein